jgi:hypothetical protein
MPLWVIFATERPVLPAIRCPQWPESDQDRAAQQYVAMGQKWNIVSNGHVSATSSSAAPVVQCVDLWFSFGPKRRRFSMTDTTLFSVNKLVGSESLR